jgi:hypothetical protein
MAAATMNCMAGGVMGAMWDIVSCPVRDKSCRLTVVRLSVLGVLGVAALQREGAQGA